MSRHTKNETAAPAKPYRNGEEVVLVKLDNPKHVEVVRPDGRTTHVKRNHFFAKGSPWKPTTVQAYNRRAGVTA